MLMESRIASLLSTAVLQPVPFTFHASIGEPLSLCSSAVTRSVAVAVTLHACMHAC
jgi:hypothetical protein